MRVHPLLSRALAAVLLSGAVATPATAANECRVEYGWTNSSGQNRSETVDIDAGQYLMGIGRSGLRYVKNVGLNDVVPLLSGPLIVNSAPRLANGQSDPPTWPTLGYAGSTTLIQIQCLTTSEAPANVLVEFYKAANRPAAEIAQLAKQAFALADAEVAVLLRNAGFTAAQVLGAMRTGLNTSVDTLAEIAEAHLGLTIQATATTLKNLGISVNPLAAALRKAYNAAEPAVVTALTQAGFTLAQVAGAVQAGFNISSEKVIEAFVKAWGTLHNETCGVAGCPPTWQQRLEALRSALGMPVQEFGNQLARVLRQTFAAMTPEAVAQFLRDGWNFTREQAQAALEFAGWLAGQVAAALNTVYGAVEQAVAQQVELESIHYSKRPDGSPRSQYRTCRHHWGAGAYLSRNDPLFIPASPSRDAWTLDFRGNAGLALVTHIDGLPIGTTYAITGKDQCSITLRLQGPSSGAGKGTARLMTGSGPGPTFQWQIGPVPSEYYSTTYRASGPPGALIMGGSSPVPDVQLRVPQPIAPLNGATCVATTGLAFGTGNAVVKLQWQPDAAAVQAAGTSSYRVEYEVQVRNVQSRANCAGMPGPRNSPNDCIYEITRFDTHDVTVIANTQYAWRVRGVLREPGNWPQQPSAREGAWSQEQFFLSAPVAIDPPVLVQPANNFLVSTSRGFSPPSVTLEWRDADNSCSAAHFEVELRRRRNDQPNAPFTVSDRIQVPANQTTASVNLDSTYRYQWRVRRMDSQAWSETRTIRTGTN